MPKAWEPPYPSWSAVFGPDVEKVVLAYFAAQTKTGDISPFHDWFRSLLSIENAPDHVERATYTDASAYRNDVYVCYWKKKESYTAWSDAPKFAEWWENETRLQEDAGYWHEVIFAPRDRLETLFSSENAAGIAAISSNFTGPITEHGYWGGMRDRIPESETNDFINPAIDSLEFLPGTDNPGKRLRILPPENLCLIRSAQDWTNCKGEELNIYQDELQPVLVEGMNFIRDNPIETGCVSCRFMDELTIEGEPQSKTFGQAYFLTMGHLEAWSKSHPTHLAIFQGFHRMVQKLESPPDLKLWHEVIVLPPGQHIFEYVNCHPFTGLLPFFTDDQPDN